MMAGISCSLSQSKRSYPDSAQFETGRFHNLTPIRQDGVMQVAKIAWRFMTEKHAEATPSTEMPIVPIDSQSLLQEYADTVIYRLGHSTLLLAVQGKYWLIDPVFSRRASPVNWAGPKRFHETPITIAELPPLAGVLISHDHYDHLDKESIRQLAGKADYFVVPLGLADYLTRWGVTAEKVTELDWWQSVQLGAVQLTATPAQHFSGRGLNDRDKTLWASWVIKTPQHNLFFSGDSGYFAGFKAIGDRFGPFDLTMIENGAYNELWSEVHMTPEESLQAHKDLQGKVMMPVHNGTFDLAMHAWYEPLERISELVWNASVALAVPKIGERMVVGEPHTFAYWWAPMMSVESAYAK